MGNLFFSCTGRTALAAECDEVERGILYDVWKSKKTNDFSTNLRQFLSQKGYYISEEFHEDSNKPIIALCLQHSRLEADVNYTLANLNSEQCKRTILILLHYRKEGTNTRIHDDQFKHQYPGMTVHNCFLRQENENVEEVQKNICKDLARRELNEIRRQRDLEQKS